MINPQPKVFVEIGVVVIMTFVVVLSAVVGLIYGSAIFKFIWWLL